MKDVIITGAANGVGKAVAAPVIITSFILFSP